MMQKFLLLATLFVHTLFGVTDFVSPEKAFIPSVSVEGKQLHVKIALAEGIYVYKERLHVKVQNEGVTLQNIVIRPQPRNHGGSLVFTSDITFVADIVKTQESLKKIDVVLSYQGCSEHGLCYEPQTKKYTLDVSNIALYNPSKGVKNTQQEKKTSETDLITQTFKDGSLGLILLTFFGFGLLLALTPCVFPMIPILSSIIIAQGEGMNAKKGFILSLVYVLSMSVTYTLAGVFAGIFGENIQASLQNPWVLSIFAAIFVILAISMFGFFEIGLPASLQSKLTSASAKAENKGGFVGVAVMGFLSALIVGPCMAPPLTGALVYIGQTGDALLGGLALFVLSLGMGMPLLLVGIGAGKFMPKPGGWMSVVSKVFGVVMLMTAIWMLSRVLSPSVIMFLWALLFIIVSVYLGALEPLESAKRSWNALIKGMGVVTLLLGVTLFIGFISGATQLLNPLEKFTASQASVQPKKIEFIKVRSIEELDKIMKQNKGKKLLVDFYADWCVSCKELEHNTFSNPQVQKAMTPYVLIQVDLTANGEKEKALSKKYNVFGPPAILFFDENMLEEKSKRIIGYKPPQEFLEFMQ